jgi:AraC family transcriptional regulator
VSQEQPVDLKGEYVEHIHLLSSDIAGWDNLNLIYELEPAGEMPETWLDRHMLIICLGNFRANLKLNGGWQCQDYARGDIVLFPAKEFFPKVQIDREVPLIELFLEPAILTRSISEAVETEKIELIPQLKLRDPLIQEIGLALKAELEVGGADSRLYAESMATALSLHLLRRYFSRKQQIRSCTGGLPKYRLRKVIDYIQEHLDQNLTLAELATAVQMSPHYFASLFKQSMGLTPHQYVTKCRIQKAKQLLRQTELPIIEICQEVGFESQSHFTRVFRQQNAMTPKAYRNYF